MSFNIGSIPFASANGGALTNIRFGGSSGKFDYTLNGRQFSVSGKSISIQNGVVMVDGKTLQDLNKGEFKQQPNISIEIHIQGDVDSVSTSNGSVIVHGAVGSVKTSSGSVTVNGEAKGNTSSMSGNINISGDSFGNSSSMSGDVTIFGKKRSSDKPSRVVPPKKKIKTS